MYLHSLAGYAAKNVYASSGGTGLLGPDQRKKYLAQARMHFETAIKLAGGSYPAAKHHLNLVRRVKSGAVPFPDEGISGQRRSRKSPGRAGCAGGPLPRR